MEGGVRQVVWGVQPCAPTHRIVSYCVAVPCVALRSILVSSCHASPLGPLLCCAPRRLQTPSQARRQKTAKTNKQRTREHARTSTHVHMHISMVASGNGKFTCCEKLDFESHSWRFDAYLRHLSSLCTLNQIGRQRRFYADMYVYGA